MTQVKRDLEDIKQRHSAFISGMETRRPLLCMNILGKEYARSYVNTFKHIPKGREIKPDDIKVEEFLKDLENFIDLTEKIGVDYFYPAVPYFYIPWTEAIIGCPIFAGRDSFYAEPFIKSWSEFKGSVDISENNKWLKKVIDMTRAIVENFGDNYPVGSSTHLRGPADMMAAALGQKEFPLELYDNPDKIRKMGSVYTEAFIEIAKILNSTASEAKFSGYVTNLFGIWTKEVCQFFQDDATALLSPRLYRQFILKYHSRIDESFPSTIFHIHPVSLYTLDDLVKLPNLKIIEINREPEAIGPGTDGLIYSFKKIQQNGKAGIIVYSDVNFTPALIEKEVKMLCDNLPNKGFCIYINTSDTEDASRKIEAVGKVINI